jgi:DNA polymerase III subunit epsilon
VLAREVLGVLRPRRAIADRLLETLLSADPRVARLDDGRWSLVADAPESPLLEACRFAVVDVETTGGSPRRGDRVIEVAVAMLVGDEVSLAYESLVNPGFAIPGEITSVTGITETMIAGAPSFSQVAGHLLHALQGTVFVAHNARFDWAFLTTELERAQSILLSGPRLCTVRLARKLVPELDHRNLDAVTYHFGIVNQARHRAAGDAMATAHALRRLLGLAREKDLRTLAELSAL